MYFYTKIISNVFLCENHFQYIFYSKIISYITFLLGIYFQFIFIGKSFPVYFL